MWSRAEFLSILDTEIAKKIFEDNEISGYVAGWKIENKAALLHANGITSTSDLDTAKGLLQLVSAFGRKDINRMHELINGNVSAGARLDYFLPLYDAKNRAGEDIFVTSVKAMLNGDEQSNISLKEKCMIHKVGANQGEEYSEIELRHMEQYINNSFDIRHLLAKAPNQETIKPTTEAIQFILRHANSYRDSNENPVIVFIPGAINIPGLTISEMIKIAVENQANINDIGLFGVPGIVWSIILGDVDSVNTFMDMNSKLDIMDEMGNKNAIAWASATYHAVKDDPEYCSRLLLIIRKLQTKSSSDFYLFKNLSSQGPLDYLDNNVKERLIVKPQFLYSTIAGHSDNIVSTESTEQNRFGFTFQ